MQKTKLLIALLFCVAIAKAQNIPDSIFSQLRFRFIGPDGNRTIAVAGEPGNPMVSYVGAASGGIFKTEDAGISWRSIFDGQDVSSIGALAIAPSNHNHVWAGTGETFLIRPAHAMGNGVYKSTDAGKTWKNMGLQVTARISRVIVHPTDTNIVYVAALGHTHAPQQERGVYKTTDGGKTWERVLFVDENTGCSDLSIDPQHPDILYAAMWQVEIKTWGLKSGGPGSGIYRTKDGGKTWEPLRNGLPGGINHPVGKTSVDVAYSNPNIVYALIEDKAPGIYRSEDGGDSWKLMSQNHSFAQRAPYYTRIRVSTKDPNQIHTICVTIMTSKDGGKTFTSPHGDYRGGGDNHDMWFDPADANRIMVAHDGCLNMTFNGGKTWSNINLPVAQMYHVAVDNQIPYNVYGNRQDGYSYKAPGISLQGSIPLGLWTGVGGCESGFAQPDPVDNTIVWSGCYDGGLDVTDTKTGYSRDVRAWPEAGYGWAPANMQYRWHWNFPLMISKHNHNTVLVGSQYVHQTTNGGQSWKIISPDLTTNDKTHQQNSGGMNSDNLMTFDGCTLYSIAESPVKEGIIWTGSNDGQVNITTDGGNHWKNVTANIPDLPKWGTIRNIDPSNFDAGTCYISVNFQQVGNFDPYIYKTTDYGTTWKLISNGIPKSNSSFVHQIKEDPAKKGLLWAGTDNALYFSPDDGNNWIHVKNNLPPAPIYGIAIQQNFNDLVLATYGRGFYILDDITPFRQITTTVLQSPVHLFNTRKTYRFRDKNGIHTENSFVTGQNPPYGASINYYLKDKTADTVKMLVKDNKGNIVRHLETTDTTGINRVWWDLSYDAINLPSLKTKPRGKDWVPLDSNGNRNMFIYDLDIGPGLTPPLVLPGTYSVELSIGKNKWTKQLGVIKDPNTKNSMTEIIKQHAFAMQLYNSVKQTLQLIEEMETNRAWLLKEINNKEKRALEEKLWQLESQLFDIYQTGSRMDSFRSPVQLLERLLSISKESFVASGDHAPTNQHLQVYGKLSVKLNEVQLGYKQLKEDFHYKALFK
ncbi:MAG: glycosyl hydrolase [Sphingobacteriales bacterium]|nr:glycosyl hydrolase [Sphingobacteriales bacterium]